MIKVYRKKPVTIEAIQWTGDNKDEIEAFVNVPKLLRVLTTVEDNNTVTDLYIDTLEGTMKASIDDFIIKGIEGEFYPCKPDIFNKTYEEVQ